MGEECQWQGAFGQLLYDFGISDASTTAYNPQANSICERMHREVGNILRCLIHSSPPRTLADAKAQVDSALATTMHVLRTNVSQSTGNSPGALTFHRDMIMNIPLQADLRAIRARRQLRVDDDLCHANACHYDFDYQPGQQVLVKRHEFTKLGERWDGPFQVLRSHVNTLLPRRFSGPLITGEECQGSHGSHGLIAPIQVIKLPYVKRRETIYFIYFLCYNLVTER